MHGEASGQRVCLQSASLRCSISETKAGDVARIYADSTVDVRSKKDDSSEDASRTEDVHRQSESAHDHCKKGRGSLGWILVACSTGTLHTSTMAKVYRQH